MYIRTVARRNKDGSCVRYVQLAQNERDENGVTRANVLYSFGREDQLDKAALRRLVHSICRFLDPAEAAQVQLQLEGVGLSLVDSRPLGGAWLLDQLWHKIGIARVLGKLLAQRRYRTELERLLFAMVANCALAPSSKLSITDWIAEEVAIPVLEPVPLPEADDRRKERKRRVNPMDEAMDFLLTAEEQIQQEVYWATADLLRLQVDLLFLDTTTAYFETGEPDEYGIRRFGHNKDHRPDRPQVVIGLAVSRDGPGAVLGLAWQHDRRERHQPGQGGSDRLEAGPRRDGGGPRLHLREQPAGDAACRRPLYRRGEAAWARAG